LAVTTTPSMLPSSADETCPVNALCAEAGSMLAPKRNVAATAAEASNALLSVMGRFLLNLNRFVVSPVRPRGIFLLLMFQAYPRAAGASRPHRGHCRICDVAEQSGHPKVAARSKPNLSERQSNGSTFTIDAP